jgi:superfamily II DNA/RNA helicase
VEYVCHKLNSHNIEAQFLHGGKTQAQRERVMRDFKEGRFRILIATDVAARGLHVENISHIINYDQANTADTHTHRIGRTGRMGKEGKAITFMESDPLPPRRQGGGHRNYDTRAPAGRRREGGFGRRRY